MHLLLVRHSDLHILSMWAEKCLSQSRMISWIVADLTQLSLLPQGPAEAGRGKEALGLAVVLNVALRRRVVANGTRDRRVPHAVRCLVIGHNARLGGQAPR